MGWTVAVGVQSGFNQVPASHTTIPVTEFEASNDHQPIYLMYVGDTTPTGVVYGNLKGTASITVVGTKASLRPLFHAVLGSETAIDTDGDTVNDTYEYVLADPQHIEVVFEDELGNQYKLTNGRITSFELSFDIGDVVKASVEILGKGIEDISLFTFPALGTEKPLVVWNTTVTLGDTGASGSTYKVSEISFSVDRGINEDSYYVGSRFIDEIDYGETNISGSFRISKNNLAEFKRALYGSTTATSPLEEPVLANIEIDAKDPSGNDKLKITIPAAIYPTGSLSISAGESTGRTFEWRAIHDAAVASPITVQLTM